MQVLVVTPPPPLVSLELAKVHLRVEPEDTDQDLVIQAYLDAAQLSLDGPGGSLGRAIGPQLLEVRLDSFTPDAFVADPLRRRTPRYDDQQAFDIINLPCVAPGAPLIGVERVAYDDQDMVEQTLVLPPDPAAVFTVDPRGLVRLPNQAWPIAYTRRGAVRIRYWAGYAVDTAADPLVAAPPPPIVAAILLMVGDLFQNRETTDTGRVAQIPMSATVERLLAPYRIWSV